MNFTREPIIETVITPKEGYRLIVRNSKGGSQEEYSIDALEVVSFGSAIFYRSLERPKSFLVPVADFEVVEMKETRVVLKNVNFERSIKIAGGKETPRSPREPQAPMVASEEEVVAVVAASPAEPSVDKKRDRRHRRRRRGERVDTRDESVASEGGQQPTDEVGEGGGVRDETQVSSPAFATLFPPPTTLISQTIARYKDQAIPEVAVPVVDKVISETEKIADQKSQEETDTPDSEISDLNRVSSTYSSQTSIFSNDTYYIT